MKLITLVKIMRPKQWVKNLVTFIPLFFGGHILNPTHLRTTTLLFIILCLTTSSIYVINDIADLERDKLHPRKRERPLPSGEMTLKSAYTLSFTLFISAILLTAFLIESEYLMLIIVSYFFVMLLYSLKLKSVGVIDVLIIALGFILRVFASAIVLQLSVNAFLVVTVIGAALLISFGKRVSEINTLGKEKILKHRESLAVYPEQVLNLIIAATFAITFMSYILFSYSFEGVFFPNLVTRYFPPLLRRSKLLLLTTPIAFYALTRYLILIYGGRAAETPENLWWEDKQFFITIMLWVFLMFFLIYFEPVANMIYTLFN
ncbi:MAG TPA: hypothetical protein ENN64_01535 [bacterium]|nr:hypothetical protein [bacterium]